MKSSGAFTPLGPTSFTATVMLYRPDRIFVQPDPSTLVHSAPVPST